MKIHYKQKFLKDLAKLPKYDKQIAEDFAFVAIHKIKSISEIKNLKKLQGHNEFYRIRFGDYRLGFSLEEDKLVLRRIAHRSDFYRKFP